MVPFACPVCHRLLTEQGNGLSCSQCAHTYPVIDTIPRFAPSDPFYEEARPGSGVYPAQYDKIRHGLKKLLFPLYQRLHLHLRTQLFQDRILDGAEGPILDAGCGGGNGHLCRFGKVTGIDISVKALQEAEKVYPQTGQASLEQLPFENGVFNVIVCNHVLEHLPLDGKDTVLAELYRVLKPGGRLIAAVPVRGDNIIYRKALRRPELFRRHFIEAVGHHGLEPPEDFMDRLKRSGFRIGKTQSDYSAIWPTGTYRRFLDNEYRSDPFFSVLVRLDGFFGSVGPIGNNAGDKLINCTLGAVSRLFDLPVPSASSSLVNVCAVKN